jgi:ParB family transcriptional regulator, chromosome partitioning protein
MNNKPDAPEIRQINPAELRPCPWNPNRMDPEDELKLDASLARHGMFKPVIVRTLDNDELEVVGGHYRRESALRLGLTSIPVVVLGRLTDAQAKEIMLLDNGRYGHDDATALAELIGSMGDPSELSAFMPFDLTELEAIAATSRINLDDLGLDEPDAAPIESKKTSKTHEILRFKVTLEDAERLRKMIQSAMREGGFTEADELTNAGDALVHLLLGERAP